MEYDRAFQVTGNNSNNSSGSVNEIPTTGTLGLTGTITIGDLVGGGFTWPGNISEFLIYNTALTTEQFRQIYDYLSAKWGFSSTKFLCCFGDSLTSGTGSTGGAGVTNTPSGNTYPAQLWALLGGYSSWWVTTDAYPGRQISQMLSGSPNYGDLYWMPQSSPKNIGIFWEQYNTLSITQSAGATISQTVQFCKARRAQGYKIIVCTDISHTPTGSYAGYANDVIVVNNYIRANWPAFADAICDLGADPRLSNYANLTYYYTDGIHLNSVGYGVVASLLLPVVQSL